ncbi:MAG: RnfABCDGE type electron transport complex subunit G [Planctomycetota bacterium]|nr:RnfABCDGE type electron transport complex subunit G [Planctomycetota bacterium]
MDVVKLGAYLFFISAVAAAALSATSSFTKERIEQNRKAKIEASFREVMPDAAKFEPCKLVKETGAVDARKAVDAAGKLIGYVAQLEPSGYADKIVVVVGVDLDKHVTGVSIARDSETPGLGKKINLPSFRDQFKSKTAADVRLKKDAPEGKIDAITAATISSRAVTDAIRKLLDNFGEEPGK